MACARFKTFNCMNYSHYNSNSGNIFEKGLLSKSGRKRSFAMNDVLTEHFFWCAVPSNSTLRPMTNYAFEPFVWFSLHFALFFIYNFHFVSIISLEYFILSHNLCSEFHWILMDELQWKKDKCREKYKWRIQRSNSWDTRQKKPGD